MISFLKKNAKPFLLISGSLLSVYIIYRKYKCSKHIKEEKPSLQNFNPIPKEKILKFFTDLREELNDLLISAVNIREDLINEHKKRDLSTENHLIRKIITPDFISSLKMIEKSISKNNEINSKDLEISLKFFYAQDPEILLLKEQIDSSIDNALNGILPEFKSEVQTLSKEKCYEFTKNFFIFSLKEIRKVFIELKNEGFLEISLGNSSVVNRLQNLNLKQEKERVLKEYGLKQTNESLSNIFSKICEEFKLNDQRFEEKMKELEYSYQFMMQNLEDSPFLISEDDIEKEFS